MTETKDIQESMLNRISDDYDKSNGSFIYDATGTVAIELNNVKNEITVVEEKQSVENLVDSELTQRVYERTGIIRHEATHATTTVEITGTPGAIINENDLVANATVNYIVIETKEIHETGKISVDVVSEEPGTIGNTPSNTIINFPVSLPGIAAVTNLERVTNGYREESDEELKARYYDFLRYPATSGNVYHYLNWAREVVGVGDARVIPTWNGGGTVKVIIIDSNKRAASRDLIDGVADHIEDNRPIGATVTVVSGEEKEITVSAKLVLASGYNIAQVKTSLEENLIAHFADIAFKDSYLSYAKISNLLFETDGVLDYSDLKVNGEIQNINLNDDEIPILKETELEV